MTAPHEPDPQFVESLAWELRTALRRQAALNGAPRRPASGLLRVVRRSLPLIIASMCAGGAATYAVTHGWGPQSSALLTARGEALVELAGVRLDYVQQEQAHRRALVEDGLASSNELPHLDLELLAAEAEVAARRLDLEETRLTGQEPEDALYAPLVEGRDFVSERLQRQRQVMLARLAIVQHEGERQGTTAAETQEMTHQLAAMETAVAELDGRLALRESFLNDERTPAEVQFEEMRSSAEAGRRTAAIHLQQLQQHHERSRILHERGLTSSSEARAIEMELRSAELRLKLADVELQILEQRLGQDTTP